MSTYGTTQSAHCCVAVVPRSIAGGVRWLQLVLLAATCAAGHCIAPAMNGLVLLVLLVLVVLRLLRRREGGHVLAALLIASATKAAASVAAAAAAAGE